MSHDKFAAMVYQHPGTLIKLYVLPDLGLSVGEAAQDLGVYRTTLSQLLNRRRDVTLEMAYKLEAWLHSKRDGISFIAKDWLALQAHYDVWQVKNSLHS